MKKAMDLVAAAKGVVRELGVPDAVQAIRRADLVIDVREADEYQQGHLQGAVLIPRGLLEFRMDANPDWARRDLGVVLYCKTGGRAALAAATLQDMGYGNVASIAGGIEGWMAAGQPIQQAAGLRFDD